MFFLDILEMSTCFEVFLTDYEAYQVFSKDPMLG